MSQNEIIDLYLSHLFLKAEKYHIITMMSGFVGIVILVEPAKPGMLVIGKIVQEEERNWSHYYLILDVAHS